ncbi:MAG: hypothetical protein PHY92_03015 [Alphaproteobacteria bacterium]|nr:hypothetical protein [Alphaproteobacteria bacterium]
MKNFLQQAKELLASNRYAYGPHRGPSGLLIYTLGNEVGACGLPRLNPGNPALPEIYYAMIATNRTGIEVITPPSGSIDLITDVEIGSEAPHRVTLSSLGTKNLIEALRKLQMIDGIGFDIPAKASVDALAELLVARLLAGGHKVEIEDSVVAGIREGTEECCNAANVKPLIQPEFYELNLITKRAIQAAEGGRKLADKSKVLYQLDDIGSLKDILNVLATRLGNVETATQGMVVAGVADANGLAFKKEETLDTFTGYPVYERGRFATLSQMRDRLEQSIASAKTLKDPGQRVFAREELAATGDRLRHLMRIEKNLLERFCACGVKTVASIAGGALPIEPARSVGRRDLPRNAPDPCLFEEGFFRALSLLRQPSLTGCHGPGKGPGGFKAAL